MAPKSEKLELDKPTDASDASTPAKETKAVRITVIGRGDHVVNETRFTRTPTMYAPGSLKWSDDDWAKARKDPNLVIEEVDYIDRDGKPHIFVSRRNRAGEVVAEGDEGLPPKPKKKAKKEDEE